MIRVLIADDQDIIVAGLSTILSDQSDIEVVATARNGTDAVELAARHRPDVCLFDIQMPGMGGVEATRHVLASAADDPVAVIVITTFDTDDNITAALQAGARGFLLKDSGPDILIQAVRAAATGEALIAPSVTARLLDTHFDGSKPMSVAQPAEPITQREEEVLVAVAKGRTNPEIAEDLHISLSTVKAHLASLMTKLMARNRIELAAWAYQTGRVRDRSS